MTLITDKSPLVVLSGGFDSTAVLHRALGMYEKVSVISMQLSGQPAKSARESKALDAILSAVDEIHGADPQAYGRISSYFRVPVHGTKHGQCSTPLPQSTIWLSTAVTFLTPGIHEVHMGYVHGDDQAMLFPHMEKAWDSMLDACGVIGSHPKLVAPFLWVSKEDMIIRGHLPSYIGHSTWCESTRDEDDCGLCSSCMRMMKAINTWKFMYPDSFNESDVFRKRFRAMVRKYRNSLSRKIYHITNSDIATLEKTP